MARGEFQEGGTLRRANPNTIQDKVLVGYQGWFTCAGDGEPIGPGHHGWLHWFNFPIPNGGRPNTDIWPDTSDYDASELYPAPGLTTASGDPVYLFSSRHPKTVQRHFHWMALHGVDGAFLQRFAGQCEIKAGNLGIRNLRDEIGDRVREAAEAEGRVFAIMYDVSGVSPDKIQNILEQDWIHLLHEQHLLDSPNYLREKGRPVVVLWGFGLNGRNHTPELVRTITEFFRSSTPGGVYLVAGTPGHWRTSSSDADRNPGFIRVWTECFDAISPWTVGRYGNEEEADRWGEERVKADADYLKKLEEEEGRKVDYIPVVLPGGSGFNLSEGKWGMNDMPRNGGQFLWRQIYNARRAGVRTIYGAMWDEYDEGTAFMPVVSYSSQLPVHPSFRFVALDIDGHELPSDWYMRIAGFAAEAFHGERTLPDTFPYKELQDYWSARPRRVGMGDDEGRKKQTDVDEVTRALKEFGVSGGSVGVLNDAPPPYSLEDTTAQQGPQGRRLQQQQQTQALASGDGRTGRPPIRQDTRPSPSHHSLLSAAVRTAAVPLAAAAVAHTLSAAPRHTPSAVPPSVNMLSHPSLSTTPYHPSNKELPMPPPLPQRTASLTPAAYDLGRQHTHGHGHSPEPSVAMQYAVYHPHHSAHVPPLGHAARPIPSPNPGMAFPSAVGYHPVPVEYGRGRSRSRSRSKSRSRSRSRTRKHKHKKGRSRSRSSSKSRKKKGRSPVRQHSQVHLVHHASAHVHHAHSHSHSHSHGRTHSPGREVHAHHHGHGHGHGVPQAHGLSPVGSSHALGFPGAGAGLHHAHSESGMHGSYTPLHSNPLGHGGLSHSATVGSYPHGYQQHQVGYDAAGYGYGYGQGGYDGMGSSSHQHPQQQGHGYAPHPSSPPSPHHASYVPGTGTSVSTPYSNGPIVVGVGGRGGIPGSIASALQTVEGVATRQTIKQFEKTVKALTNRGNTFINKLK